MSNEKLQKMDTLQVPSIQRYTIQPMDASKLSSRYDDIEEDEIGLGYQNTLVSTTINFRSYKKV